MLRLRLGQPFAAKDASNVRVVAIAIITTMALAVAFTPHTDEDDASHMTHQHAVRTAAAADTTDHATTNTAPDDHAHTGGVNGASHSMSMPMYFTVRMTGQVLFSFIDVTSRVSYVTFCIALMCACVLREYLHVYRLELEKQNAELQLLHAAASAASGFSSNDGQLSIRLETHRKCCGIFSSPALSSLLYAFNMLLAYLIMLCVMAYDFLFLLVILVSSGGAHFWFQHVQETRRNASLASTQRMSSPREHRRRGESSSMDNDELAQLTPMVTSRGGEPPNRMSGGNSPGISTSKKLAALQLNITKDCCES